MGIVLRKFKFQTCLNKQLKFEGVVTMTSGLVYHNLGQLENWISLYLVTQCYLSSQNAAFYMI